MLAIGAAKQVFALVYFDCVFPTAAATDNLHPNNALSQNAAARVRNAWKWFR